MTGGRRSILVRRTNRCAALAAIGPTVVACVVMTGCDDGDPVSGFSRAANAVPTWNGAPVAPEPPAEPEAVNIHLDVSYPMAGFLPPGPAEASLLRTAAQNTASHLSRVYGGGAVSIRWHAVGHDIDLLFGTPRIERSLFNGRWSRLGLSIERILTDFRTGRSEAAALVTDLVATGDIVGPLAISNALADWLTSDDVRSGAFHAALLGVRADYWGWHPQGCPEALDQPGCVHNERTGAVTRLPDVVQMPFYVLVLGRDVERVEAAIESVRSGLEELRPDAEIKREILTRRSSEGFSTELSCLAGEQFALFENDRGLASCQREATITLSCRFAGGLQLRSATADVEPAVVPGATSVYEIAQDGLKLDIDCAALLESSEPVNVHLRAVDGSLDRAWEVDWSEWSTEIDELGKTLQLDGFVQELRIVPDRYRIELQQPILEFGPQ